MWWHFLLYLAHDSPPELLPTGESQHALQVLSRGVTYRLQIQYQPVFFTEVR